MISIRKFNTQIGPKNLEYQLYLRRSNHKQTKRNKIMETIKQVLMRRDNMTAEEANELIQEAKETLIEYLEHRDFMAAEDICQEFFGLEPDYIMELML